MHSFFFYLEAYRDQEPSPDHSSDSESGSESSHSRSQSPSSSGSSSSEEGSRDGTAPLSEAPQSSSRSSALCLRNISARSGGIVSKITHTVAYTTRPIGELN